MKHRVVTVQFWREGAREGVALDPGRPYSVRVDGGPPGTFVSPWSQEELEQAIDTLRNVGDDQPTSEQLKKIGKALGAAIHRIDGMEAALQRRGDEQVTVYWQLDYPELSRIPWELATTNQPPYHHLLDDGISCVRMVPAYVHDAPVRWPTGLKENLRLLFVWGEDKPDAVPHKAQLPALENICKNYGVEFVHGEIASVEELTRLCSAEPANPVHFVHILAHGAKRDGNWGLRLKNEIAKPEQIAKALRAGGTSPAIVTVAACDSANDKDNSFGSIGYQLHVYGVPLVVASQFRLRKSAANLSAAMVYASLLRGDDVRDMLKGGRRQLAPQDNEAWANEVIFTRYRYDALEELAVVARQQGALRHANVICEQARGAPADKIDEFIARLDEEVRSLQDLLASQKSVNAAPQSIAETCGLLGSLLRRQAHLRADPPDQEDLRCARDWYAAGMRADANSHYCGINVVHLSLRLDDHETAQQYIPIVRFAATNQRERDFWCDATAGELEVYAGNQRAATEYYRNFVEALVKHVADKDTVLRNLRAAKKQLDQVVKLFAGDDAIRRAAEASRKVLESALRRHS